MQKSNNVEVLCELAGLYRDDAIKKPQIKFVFKVIFHELHTAFVNRQA